MARAVRRKSASTPMKKGVKHAIKKPKATKKTSGAAKLKAASIPVKKKILKDARKAKQRDALKPVANNTLDLEVKKERRRSGRRADSNENLAEKVKSEEEDIENEKENEDFKQEEEDSDIDDDDVSAYEKIRLKNIREREAMFQEIQESKSRVSAAFTPKQTDRQGASKRGLASVKREKEVLPPRKSARLAGGKVAEIQRYVPELAPEPEHERLELITLPVKDTLKEGDDPERLAAASTFLADLTKNMGVASDKKSSFGTSQSERVSRMKKMKIAPELVAKVTPDRIFSLAVHPTSHKVLVAAGGKWGAVGLWDVMDRESKEDGVYSFSAHARPVNYMSWNPWQPEELITTSYDGTCRIFDMEKMEHRILYGDEEFLEKYGNYTAAHVQIDASKFLVTKGKTGSVGLVDTRVGYTSTVQDYHVFDRVSPKCLDLHPVQRNLFLSANNKGGCFVFDMRHHGRKQLMDSICELGGHARSISSALFSPVTGNKVVTLAWDDKMRLFDTEKMTGTLRGKETRHNNNTGRWLTPFKALWHPGHDDLLFTGSMGRPRQLEAWQADAHCTKLHNFEAEELGSICSIISVHPSLDLVAGGNSSGRVHVFMNNKT